ncbi:MAG: hypothetical protein GXP38_05910 [Chloroflexi bacterium]|nr:hypothetical protein [Chloroflexota bacterium]
MDEYLHQLGPDDRALLNIFTNGWCTNEKAEESSKGASLRACPYGAAQCEQSCRDHYREFITTVAEHVRDNANGGIAYMQRDTEPASIHHFPADKPEEYVEIQKLFYAAVKSVLPGTAVIGVNHNGSMKGGVPTQPAFFDYVLEHGKDDFDLLDVRLYEDIYSIPRRVNWFRERMQSFGYDKPIVSTEQGGPDPRTLHNGGTYLFKQLRNLVEDTCSQAPNYWACMQEWVAEHPEQVDPKLQPFFLIATPEQEILHGQMQCHDITQRNVMMLAAGVQATWWWNLQSPGTHPVFGKMRLRSEDLQQALAGYECYQRMVEVLGNVSSVRQIALSDENITLFEIQRNGESEPMYVAWYREQGLDAYDAFMAEPVPVSLPLPFSYVRITDVFGREETKAVSDGMLQIDLSDTPLFIHSEAMLSIPKPVASPRPIPQPSPTPTPTPLPDTQPITPQVGVNFIRFYFDDQNPAFQPEQIFQDFAALGVQAYRQFVKTDLMWDMVEPEDNQWHFARADTVIPHSDFEPIVTLFSYQYASPTPPWCSDPAQFQKTLGEEAQDYLAHVIDRYAPYVRYWEIGNEMDHWRAADPQDRRLSALPKCYPLDGFSPQEQGAFLAQVAEIIRQRDEDAVIILPGMGGLSSYTLDTWLAGVIEGGGSDWFDVVNYHFYGAWQPYTRLRAQLATFLNEHNLGDKPVWLSETGATSSPSLTLRTDYPNSPQTQAADVFRRLIQAWGTGDRLVLWHSYIGSADVPSNLWRQYGLREADATAKPALYSFQLLTQELIPFRQVVPLAVDPRGSNVYKIITQEDEVKYVAWGQGSFIAPDTISKMTSVIPDATGHFSWQTVNPGQEITLFDIPILLK